MYDKLTPNNTPTKDVIDSTIEYYRIDRYINSNDSSTLERLVPTRLINFKLALVNSLIDSHTNGDNIIFESIPISYREDKDLLRKMLNENSYGYENLYENVPYLTSSISNMIGAGLLKCYNIDGIINLIAEEDTKDPKISFCTIECNKEELKNAFINEIYTYSEGLKRVLNNLTSQDRTFSLNIYQNLFPNFIFALWSISGELPEEITPFNEHKQKEDKLVNPYYNIVINKDACKKLEDYLNKDNKSLTNNNEHTITI